MNRRDLIKALASAGVGAAAAKAASSAGGASHPLVDEVITAKGRSLEDPYCADQGFAPGERIENGLRINRDVAVRLRDGVVLYVDIYRAADQQGKVPAIMAASPYGKQPRKRMRIGVAQAADASDEDFGLVRVSNYAMDEAPDPVYWCKHGYAVVNCDARGARRSGGVGQIYGSQGGRDYADVIEFLGIQDWCNGKVGMSGNSALATWQWMTAAQQPKHLACIAPWEGWSDLYRQIVMPGGIPEVGIRSLSVKNWCGGAVEDVVAMIHKYPLMNAYWQDKIVPMEQINVPVYVTANFKHWHCLGSLEGFRRVNTPHKWLRVINNQEWPDYYALPQMEDLRRFFDRYLKDEDNDWELTPNVRLSTLDPGGLDTVNRPEKEWPLARTRYTKIYLDAASSSMSDQPVAASSSTSYDGETGHAEFIFRFDRETELTGYLKLKLWVEAAGADDMDLFVYVQKLDRAGRFLPSLILNHAHPGAQGWLRVSHRELDAARSTPAEPYHPHTRKQPLRAGEIVPIEIGIVPTSMRWHPGQQLRVIVSGHFMREPTWFEKFRYESRSPGKHIIHTGGQYDSHLLVPNIPLSGAVDSVVERNKAVARRYFTDITDLGKLGFLDEIVAENCIVHRPELSEPLRGILAYRQGLERAQATYADFHTTIHEIFGEDDRVACRLTHRAVNRGVWHSRIGSHDVAGKPVTWDAIVVFRFDAGKIAEQWVCRDELGMLIDLGVLARKT